MADEAEAEETTNSKPYIEGSVGAGIVLGGGVVPIPVLTLGVMPAYAFSRSFALGLGFGTGFWGPAPGGFALPFSASAVTVFRPNETGFECALSVGAETLAVAGGGCAASSNCGNSTILAGPRVGVRPGYVWPSGFGIALDASLWVIANGDEMHRVGVLALEGLSSNW